MNIDADRLDLELALRGLSVRGLGRRSGVPHETITRARAGRNVRLATLLRLALVLADCPETTTGSAAITQPSRRGGADAPATPTT